MTKHEQEILNRCGEKILKTMLVDFPKGFHIVASDLETYTVGDGETNITYSRDKAKKLSKHTLIKTKLTRKGLI